MEGNLMQLPEGDIEFETEKEVGAGGFGSVYRGKSRLLGTEVAVKVPYGMSREAVKKEVDMMRKAIHKHVTQVLSTYEKDGRLGMVMEYMPRGSLRCLLEKVEDVPWALRFRILHEVALGMNYLHVLQPRILHRDLKPDNVLLDSFLVVKLTDFGLSRNETSVSTNQHGAPGSLSYIPPEALCNQYTATTKFDVYSFAILTWSVLSGKRPYEGINSMWILNFVPSGRRPNMDLVNCWKNEEMVPEAIEMMERCWDEKPEKRPDFSECMVSTEKMCGKYGEHKIKDARNEVLNKLDNISSSSSYSSEETRVADVTDGKTLLDLNTLAIDDFAKLLNPKETQVADKPDGKTPSDLDTQVVNDFAKLLNPKSNAPDPDPAPAPAPPPAAPEEELNIKDPKKFLLKNRTKMVEATPDLTEIVNTLHDQKFIGKEARNDILKQSDEERVRRVVDLMRKNGPESSKYFLKLLRLHHPFLMSQLHE